MKIAITGHRPSKLGNDYATKLDELSPLMQAIRREIEEIVAREKPEALITGMALGIDQLFAQIAISMNIPFMAAIPCIDQHSKWPMLSQWEYNKMLNHSLCTTYYISNREYTSTCMQDRNIWMVDNCDLLIAVWDGSSGGTANCIKYAESKNKRIIYLNPKSYEKV